MAEELHREGENMLTVKQVTKYLELINKGVERGIAWLRVTREVGPVLSRISTLVTGSTRKLVCNACKRVVDTESAKYPPTKHARVSRETHQNECEAWRAIEGEIAAWEALGRPKKAAPGQTELDAGSVRVGEEAP